MARTSFGDMVVLFMVVLAASVDSGSSFSKDASQRKQLEVLKLSGLPPSTTLPPAAGARVDHAGGDVRGAPRRAKRCTCYTYKDKECVYYCHLDIIWINTPERSVPYGMSNYQRSLRRRRSAETDRVRTEGDAVRCVCALQTDSHCTSFCMDKQRTSMEDSKLT